MNIRIPHASIARSTQHQNHFEAHPQQPETIGVKNGAWERPQPNLRIPGAGGTSSDAPDEVVRAFMGTLRFSPRISPYAAQTTPETPTENPNKLTGQNLKNRIDELTGIFDAALERKGYYKEPSEALKPKSNPVDPLIAEGRKKMIQNLGLPENASEDEISEAILKRSLEDRKKEKENKQNGLT
jgi:hypothetical protein